MRVTRDDDDDDDDEGVIRYLYDSQGILMAGWRCVTFPSSAFTTVKPPAA